MAEFSGRWTTSGTPVGHQQISYTQAQDSTIEKIVAACSNFEGIAPSYLNSLAGTVTGANTVSINTGGALIDGKSYNNSAAVAVTIPSSVGGGNTRIDRIVLRCSWAGFIVSITRIAGTDAGSPAVPAITQVSGTTYDLPLYQALVNTAGTVTLTDERQMASIFTKRQGGSATDWSVSGASNYPLSSLKVQTGTSTVAILMGNTYANSSNITFPVAFSQPPLVFLSMNDNNSVSSAVNLSLHSLSGMNFSVQATRDGTGAGQSMQFNWLAIGPV